VRDGVGDAVPEVNHCAPQLRDFAGDGATDKLGDGTCSTSFDVFLEAIFVITRVVAACEVVDSTTTAIIAAGTTSSSATHAIRHSMVGYKQMGEAEASERRSRHFDCVQPRQVS